MRLRSVGHHVQVDMQVKVDRERLGVTSLVTSRERAARVLEVRVPAVQDQNDPRVPVGVVVDVLVAVPVGLEAAQGANLQGSPDREQAVNQGEAALHARGKCCDSWRRSKNCNAIRWKNQHLVPPNDSPQNA
jgi:hypothetical protein